jgi:hypothetical protein
MCKLKTSAVVVEQKLIQINKIKYKKRTFALPCTRDMKGAVASLLFLRNTLRKVSKIESTNVQESECEK